jgi:hypothetical protein
MAAGKVVYCPSRKRPLCTSGRKVTSVPKSTTRSMTWDQLLGGLTGGSTSEDASSAYGVTRNRRLVQTTFNDQKAPPLAKGRFSERLGE